MRYNKFIHKRIGETQRNKKGLLMTIVGYRKSNDIDVQFENGVKLEHVRYEAFKSGTLRINMKYTRIGECVLAKCGLKATITKYKNYNNIEVTFEDGVVVACSSYASFKQGWIRHPEKSTVYTHEYAGRTNKESYGSNGMKIKIIKAHANSKVDVQFEDGEIVYNADYSNFRNRRIAHPKYSNRKNHIGNKVNSKGDLDAKITTWRTYLDYDIQFDDGTIVSTKGLHNLSNAMTLHPKFSYCTLLFRCNDEEFYECICKKCKNKHILKLSEMKNFECKGN